MSFAQRWRFSGGAAKSVTAARQLPMLAMMVLMLLLAAPVAVA